MITFKVLRLMIFSLLIVLFVKDVQAANWVQTNGKIVAIGNGWAGEGYYFEANVNSAHCGSKRYVIPKSHPGYKDAVGALMFAMAKGLSVTISYDRDVPCWGPVAPVVGIYMWK